ncbi:MAG TPA: hypothetical protein V6C97_00770 [Oculatellaceae cyanobacterium]
MDLDWIGLFRFSFSVLFWACFNFCYSQSNPNPIHSNPIQSNQTGRAIHSLLTSQPGIDLFSEAGKLSLLSLIRSTAFNDTTGTIRLDSFGDRIPDDGAFFDVVNLAGLLLAFPLCSFLLCFIRLDWNGLGCIAKKKLKWIGMESNDLNWNWIELESELD